MGRAGFVLASADTLEEWDAVARVPLRRLRLGRPLVPAFVGGHADRVWMISRRSPRHVEIITLVNSSSHTIELSEEVLHVAANAKGDLLAMICGEARSTYVVNLARRTPALRIDRGPMADVAWLSAYTLVLKPVGQPAELLALPGQVEHSPAAPTALAAPVVPPVSTAHDTPAPLPARPAEAPPREVPQAGRDEPRADAAALAVARGTRDQISQRFAAMRGRLPSRSGSSSALPAASSSSPAPAEPPSAASPTRSEVQPFAHPGGWRVDLANWAQSICAGSYCAAPALDFAILDDLLARFELDELRDAVALLYGAYLNGLAGVAPVDLAAVLHWQWDEAIGDGRIERTGIVYRRHGRIALTPEAVAALDGRRPRTGTIVGREGTRGTPGAIVAPSDVDVLQLGTWAAPIVGALLVANQVGERAPRRLVLEARIRGLVPLVAWPRLEQALGAPPQSAAIVVEHAATAAGLALPIVATWSAPSRPPA
jgi:hypothetical protein